MDPLIVPPDSLRDSHASFIGARFAKSCEKKELPALFARGLIRRDDRAERIQYAHCDQFGV